MASSLWSQELFMESSLWSQEFFMESSLWSQVYGVKFMESRTLNGVENSLWSQELLPDTISASALVEYSPPPGKVSVYENATN